MSRFKGAVKGFRGVAERNGTESSGISVEAAGWISGVLVRGWVNDEEDVFEVCLTRGSNLKGGNKVLGYVKVVDGRIVWEEAEGEKSLEV